MCSSHKKIKFNNEDSKYIEANPRIAVYFRYKAPKNVHPVEAKEGFITMNFGGVDYGSIPSLNHRAHCVLMNNQGQALTLNDLFDGYTKHGYTLQINFKLCVINSDEFVRLPSNTNLKLVYSDYKQ